MAAKPRILFVDDEPSILRALRNGLWADRERWELVFAGGSGEALEQLATTAFDVIVSDLKMPGMDGEQLLLEVARRYPATVSILLSGHADAEMLPALRPVLYDILSKPCPRNHLRAVVEGALVERCARGAS